MAIEDAEGLRLLTQPGVTPESVPDILKRIDSVRRPRATKVLIVSFLESSIPPSLPKVGFAPHGFFMLPKFRLYSYSLSCH